MTEHPVPGAEGVGPDQSGPAAAPPSDTAAPPAAVQPEAAAPEQFVHEAEVLPEPVGAEALPTDGDQLAAERLADLQRLQAEYVNYKRRVDRDRAVMQERAVHSVIEALLPVLDDIDGARQHGDLSEGPFASIAEKLESTLGKFGVERFGETGESFDPNRHEALMHVQADLPEGTEATTVVQVLQPGYRAGETVIRAARVAVADPQ